MSVSAVIEFDRRQRGNVDLGGRGRLARVRRVAASRRGRLIRRLLALRFARDRRRVGHGLAHRALAPRPACQEGFVAHSSSSRMTPRRASACGSARSRLRLKNTCSTWCSATKAATVSRTGSGIGTVSTRSVAGSVKASPSAGFGRYREYVVRRLAVARAQHDPQERRFAAQIVPIVGRLRLIEVDAGAPGVERGGLLIGSEHGPRCGLRLARQHRDRAPHVLDPRAVGLAPLDHDTDRDAHKRARLGQLTASGWRTGRPVTRLCGFSRMIRSGVIARIRYTGSSPIGRSTTPGSAKRNR